MDRVLLYEFDLQVAAVGDRNAHVDRGRLAAVTQFGKGYVLEDEERSDAERFGPVPRRLAPVRDDETALHDGTDGVHQPAR